MEGEEAEFGEVTEELVGILSVGRATDILPGGTVVGREEGITTSWSGVGDSREEESRGERGSSGCVMSAGSGEGVFWGLSNG